MCFEIILGVLGILFVIYELADGSTSTTKRECDECGHERVIHGSIKYPGIYSTYYKRYCKRCYTLVTKEHELRDAKRRRERELDIRRREKKVNRSK